MQLRPPAPFVAVTDPRWFDFLSLHAVKGRLDEANFWSPRTTRRLGPMRPGDPVFLRLKSPRNVIAGYGFFAHACALELREAWRFFGWKNGDPDEVAFRRRIGEYRHEDLRDPRVATKSLGCTVLRDLRLWPRERWIAWGEPEAWAKNIVRGKGEDDPARASRLIGEILADGLRTPEDLAEDFEPLEVDERSIVEVTVTQREGQGAFRSRLLDAYGRCCAIIGEHTGTVLDAAHIQRYLGPRSNHVRNGLLLTQEFHTLFDEGYVTVTPELVVRVSPRLQADWNNGHRCYEYNDHPLANVPEAPGARPSPAALEWHRERVFRD